MSEDFGTKPAGIPPEVEKFLLDDIDSVPHLEALLLLWNSRPAEWQRQDVAKSLFVSSDSASGILEDLKRRHLVSSPSGNKFRYQNHPDRDALIASVDATYRRELIRVSRLIHAKPSASVREFARAFRLRQDSD